MTDDQADFEATLHQATRAYTERVHLDRTPEAVVADVLARPAPPRRAFAVLVAVLVLAVSGGLAISQVVLREGWLPGGALPTATPAVLPQVWPESQLPAPYDWSGVQAALAPRGFELNEPAEEERRALTVHVDEAITTVLESFQAERASLVGVHLAAVSFHSERMEGDLVRELMYVIETTGHDTGNCFTLLPATQLDAPTIGACFYPNRSAPR